jgi:hypothetical protein
MLGPSSPPRLLEEDAAHGLGGCGKEMSTTVPMLRLLHIHQSEVRFMNQGRGFKRLARLLLGQLLCRQLT